MRIIGLVCLILGAAALASFATIVTAQSFSPTNPLQFVIPIPAGCTASMTVAAVTISCTPALPPPPPPPPLSITTPLTLPAGTAGKLYTFDLSTLAKPTGGVPPYVFAGVNFPAWLKISPAGVLSGTPPAAGTFSFSFTVTDSSTVKATAQLPSALPVKLRIGK